MGKELLTFKNTSKKSTDTLFLHLYPNAFQSETTLFMRESFFSDKIKKMEKYRGFIKIEKVKIAPGVDLTDEKIIDQTIMKLPLPVPLGPQEKIELEIEFMVKLPELFVRLGYLGDDFMIGQWFPKMAVLEEGGSWNAHQYHFNSEFFADFGTYDVSITVPLEYVIAATGYLVKQQKNVDSTKTLVFHAEDVHDFAWAASPDFQISERIVDGIKLNFFYKPRHQKDVERIMDLAEFALKYYNTCFGRYAYDHFTLVDTKIGFGGGAMEYPTLITVSPSRLPSEKIRVDAMVIFHEVAHQWWYGMVASNEFEEAWLDEGFAVFSQRRALEQRFGEKANLVHWGEIKISDLNLAKLGYLLDPSSDPIVKDSWEFQNFLSYRTNVYSKASLVLETLKNYLSQEKMEKLLKEYFRRYRFKHPCTQDFVQLVNEMAGEGTSFWLKQLLFETGLCDYGVESIESFHLEGQDEKRRYQNRILVRRLGDVIIPVGVEIVLEDGKRIHQLWDGKERWHKIEIEAESKIKSAIIDPENKIALDINVNNNSLSAETNERLLMKFFTHSLFCLETLLHLLTCF